MTQYLTPTAFIDSDAPDVIAYANSHTQGATNDVDRAMRLYYAVRDDFYYNPYYLDLRPEGLKASALLRREPRAGYCVEKAVLLAAVARVVGIPSRLSFYNVRNHIATGRLESLLQTNLLVFHGCTELLLEGTWVKATPAFNASLCTKLNVEPLEFNGREDSVLQQFDRSGNTYMHYEHDYGAFADLPYDLYMRSLQQHYGHIITEERLKNNGYILEV